MTRREALRMGGAAALLAGGVSRLQVANAKDAKDSGAEGKPAVASAHGLRPAVAKALPFDAKKLKGISEKMIVSHHDNNYVAAVNGINKVRDQLGQTNKDTAGFLVGGLKQSELQYSNSIILHEHYFGNLGGDGKASGTIEKALSEHYGSFGRFEELFRSTGASLGGGSGWTVLAYNFHNGDLEIQWSGNHTQALAYGQPLLVMDMYEHAYQIDYGAAAAKYIEAFWQNIHWDEVNRRFEKASKAAATLRA